MMISKLDNASRGQMYALLSRLYRAEVDGELLDALKALALPQAEGALAEGYALLKNYLDSCGENALEELAVDYANLFLAAGSADGAAAIPCESVYTSPKRIFMQDAWEDVSRRYAGKGLGRDGALNDLHEDHLALELEFMTWLVEHGSPEEQADFLNTHLLDWVPAFAADIEKYARWDFYKAVGRITAAFLALEGEFLSTLVSGGARQSRSFSVRADRMAPIFTRLKEKYRIFAPKRFPGRGPKGGDLIRYGRIDAITDVVYNEKAHFSAKEVFYPVSQTMLYFNGDHCTEKELEDDKGILLFVRPCDINAIRRLDQIFLRNGQPDLYYARMREKVKLILLECREGFENCFCVSMGSNVAWDYAAAVRIDDICALTEICDEELLPYFQDEVPIEFAPEFVEENRRAARPPRIDSRERLGQVCQLDYWNQFDDGCIACGGCNTVCPTCSCFDTVDIIYNETSRDGERRRVWSSCMLRDFTQTAGGGMARKTQGANMRFKVLHKMYDYKARFGVEHMCVGCGRCIDRCPKGIDYLDAVNGLTDALAGGKGDG
jgi:anaerobic sulfite reductase subunit A